MTHIRYVIGLLGFLAAVIATAQEQAVDAKDEPHHRPKFVNEVVRVLDVEVLPGEATQYTPIRWTTLTSC